MEHLLTNGWHFEFFQNQLDSYTCVATKGKTEVCCDNFKWWSLICDIVKKCDKYERK